MTDKMLARPSTSSTPISLPDFPLKSHSAKKISSLYEVEYLDKRDKVQPTDLPTLCQNNLLPLEILAEFPAEWARAGYTHIYFGAIRLALNYHGTAGKPVVVRIVLLDSRYLEYQNVCIATIEAILNSGIITVTLFPNFTMALADPNLTTALKVQIQIAGAPQVASAIAITLHYQIVYRIQDHAFNLSRHGTYDSLLISTNTNDQPHCIHVPRKIPKKELIKLLPEK
ncbi:hypothetical protein PVK06_003239 [Gossypium arboreum]|uniref:Uncharacterized protein n=1 Tax=Gossypium arboreum TaxID=29729 RepID=A0ABR0R761_GOSAR|nr:hypothetical protein PVK06_003239 [Gossypium arboreum]